MGRKVINTMALDVTGLSGAVGNPNAKWRIGACRNLEDEPDAGLAIVDMDENPQYANVNRDGYILEPYIEQIAGNIHFELLSAAVDGTISTSRKASD
jgi:hypothetical protein